MARAVGYDLGERMTSLEIILAEVRLPSGRVVPITLRVRDLLEGRGMGNVGTEGGRVRRRGPATVELAVVAPVLVVLALISYNMMVFVSATARFDRVAPDIVLAHGSSPPTSESDAGGRDVGCGRCRGRGAGACNGRL